MALPLLITYYWHCLSNYDVRYLCAYIKSHWSDVFLWTLQKVSELYLILRVGNHLQMESFHRSLGNLPRNLWKLSANGKLPHQNSKEIPAVKAVEATFAFIYLCLLHSAGLNFSIKYISYVSCVFPSCKSVIILKFPLSHVLILPSCNSGCQIYFL